MLLNKNGGLSDALCCGAQREIFHHGGLQEETNETDLGSERRPQSSLNSSGDLQPFCADGYE